MKSKILSIIAITLKLLFFWAIISYGLSKYKFQNSLIDQHIIVYLLLYIPCFMGIESIIFSLFKKEDSKNGLNT